MYEGKHQVKLKIKSPPKETESTINYVHVECFPSGYKTKWQ